MRMQEGACMVVMAGTNKILSCH